MITLSRKFRWNVALAWRGQPGPSAPPLQVAAVPVHEKIKKSVASVFILTSKTLVIAKFMILTKVKLRSESNHR